MFLIVLIFSLSALSIILGFIALLTQKIYIDSDSKQLTQIEIPIIGKMKTNYPALIFVIGGLVLAYITIDQSFPPRKISWEIRGSFISENSGNIDWDNGTLAVFPVDFKTSVRSDGVFIIQADIDEGKTFEEIVQYIDYSHKLGTTQIYPQKQYTSYLNGEESLIDKTTKESRKYKPKPINLINPVENN